MMEIILGSFLLSLIHAAIPNHWVPIITLSKVQNWGKVFTNLAIIISSSAHSLSTIIVGSIIGIAGYAISQRYEEYSKIIASSILVVMGIIFVFSHLFSYSKHHHHHGGEFHLEHSHKKSYIILTSVIGALTVVTLLAILLFEKNTFILLILIAEVVMISVIVYFKIKIYSQHKLPIYKYHVHDTHEYHSRNHAHEHTHHIHSYDHEHLGETSEITSSGRSKYLALFSLSLALFLSPCVEIEVYYFKAGILGIPGILATSLVYLFTTVVVTFALVKSGTEIISRFKLDKLEHNEDIITGVILIILGFVSYLA